jgi:hypothetical protein
LQYLKRSWRRIKQLFLSRSTTYHPLRGSASLFDQVSLIKKYQYFGTGIHNLKRLCIFTPAGRRCDERRHKPCRPSQHTRSATRAFVPRQRLQPCVDREAVQFHFASIVTALDHSNCFADFVCFSINTSFLLLYHNRKLTSIYVQPAPPIAIFRAARNSLPARQHAASEYARLHKMRTGVDVNPEDVVRVRAMKSSPCFYLPASYKGHFFVCVVQ